VTTPVSGSPDDNPAVPSHAPLFEDPADTPPVLSTRSTEEVGRLYRSAGAVGLLAEAAIPALSIDVAIDPDLPVSPEVLAAQLVEPATEVPAPEAPAVAIPSSEVDGVVEDEVDAVVEEIEPALEAESADELPLLEPPSAPIVALPAVQQVEVEPAAEPDVFTPIEPIALRSEPALPLHGDDLPADVDAAVPMNVALAASTAVAADDSPSLNERIVAFIPTESDGLTWSRAALIMVLGTVLAAFVEALLRHSIGSLTGIVLVILTIFCAIRLRREDIWAAVIMPPLAFLAAIVTAGQLTMNRSGSFLSRQALNIVTVLALNAPWILGATAIGLVIVLIRIFILSRNHDGNDTQQPDVAAAS